MRNFMAKYDENIAKIKTLLTKKERIKGHIFGALLAIICLISFAMMLANLLIFVDYLTWVIIGFAILVILFCFLSEFFTIIIFKNYNKKIKEISFKVNYLQNLITSFIVCSLLALLLIFFLRWYII